MLWLIFTFELTVQFRLHRISPLRALHKAKPFWQLFLDSCCIASYRCSWHISYHWGKWKKKKKNGIRVGIVVGVLLQIGEPFYEMTHEDFAFFSISITEIDEASEYFSNETKKSKWAGICAMSAIFVEIDWREIYRYFKKTSGKSEFNGFYSYNSWPISDFMGSLESPIGFCSYFCYSWTKNMYISTDLSLTSVYQLKLRSICRCKHHYTASYP